MAGRVQFNPPPPRPEGVGGSERAGPCPSSHSQEEGGPAGPCCASWWVCRLSPFVLPALGWLCPSLSLSVRAPQRRETLCQVRGPQQTGVGGEPWAARSSQPSGSRPGRSGMEGLPGAVGKCGGVGWKLGPARAFFVCRSQPRSEPFPHLVKGVRLLSFLLALISGRATARGHAGGRKTGVTLENLFVDGSGMGRK